MQVGRLFTQAVLKFGYRNASPSWPRPHCFRSNAVLVQYCQPGPV